MPNGWRIGFYAFDLLQVDNRKLSGEPLSVRCRFLREVLNGSGLRISDHLQGTPAQIVEAVR